MTFGLAASIREELRRTASDARRRGAPDRARRRELTPEVNDPEALALLAEVTRTTGRQPR